MLPNDINEIKKMIDKSAEDLFSKMNGIPKIQKQTEGVPNNIKWRVKYFFITEQTTADEYANFMTTLIQNPTKYSILREKENWTQSGELIKIVEYLEKEV
jgi:hypothetical protein